MDGGDHRGDMVGVHAGLDAVAEVEDVARGAAVAFEGAGDFGTNGLRR